MGTHKNIRQSRIFVVNLTELNVIPGVQLVVWKNILLKKIRFSLYCVWIFDGLCSSAAQLAKTKAKDNGSVLTAIIWYYSCVNIVDVENNKLYLTLFVYSLI